MIKWAFWFRCGFRRYVGGLEEKEAAWFITLNECRVKPRLCLFIWPSFPLPTSASRTLIHYISSAVMGNWRVGICDGTDDFRMVPSSICEQADGRRNNR